MLSPGTVVERYEVERELGGGGMARVYKVRHVALGSVHALKVLAPELVVNAELRARFLEEGRIQARLRHPHIVSITDVVATPGVAGLVMEYLEGESLDTYLARLRQPLALEEVRDIFLQTLEGVAFAHEQGIVHRDLKPSNLFLEQVRGQRVVRVLDFGIAKVSGREASTRTGMRMGTPQYMSPEQIRGARDVTLRSDIFSLGATLYELATGRVCFEGESDFNIMEKIVRGEYVPPEEARPGMDPALARAIHTALEPEPEHRFGSCRQFAAALMSWGHVEPAPAPAARARPPVPAAAEGDVPWTVPEPAPFARVPPPGPVHIPSEPSTPVRAAPLPALPLPEAPRPPVPSPPSPPKRRAGLTVLLAGLAVVAVLGGSVALYGHVPGAPAVEGTRPEPEPAPVRSGRLVIEARPAYRTVLELTDPRGERLTVMSPYTNPEALPGPWRVVAKASGFEEERQDILVKPGESAVLQMRLKERVGGNPP